MKNTITTFDKLSPKDIFINGDHINDIVNEHKIVLGYGPGSKHTDYTTQKYFFMSRNGTKHSPNNIPGAFDVIEKANGEYQVIKEVFFDYGHLHRADGPAICEYHNDGTPSHCEYYLNDKRITQTHKYFKDEWNPTQEELYMFIMGNL